MRNFLTLLFIIVSLFSAFFIARRYRIATPLQRRQIIFAAAGAIAVAAMMYFLVAFR